MRKRWNVPSADPMWKNLSSDSLIFAHYRARNIRDYVVHAHTSVQHVPVQRSLDGTTGLFPYRNFSACENSKNTGTFTSHVTSRKYNIRQCFTCTVYLDSYTDSSRSRFIYSTFFHAHVGYNMEVKPSDLLKLTKQKSAK